MKKFKVKKPLGKRLFCTLCKYWGKDLSKEPCSECERVGIPIWFWSIYWEEKED